MRSEWEMFFREWTGGTHSRDTALRLFFLAWYSCAEPQYLSGMEGVDPPPGLIDELFDYLGGQGVQDLETLFVIEFMADVAPWCLGNEHRWTGIAQTFRFRRKGRQPSPEVFNGRGGYGDYFRPIAEIQLPFA